MRKPVSLSILLLLGVAVLGWGAVAASSFRSSPRASASVTAQSANQSQPQGQYGFIGYVGDVVTYHYNVARQGQNTLETVLTPANVNSTTFGKLGFFTVDGKVDAQPLYLYKMPIGPSLRNTLYVVTENDSAYAFDADSGAQLWKVSAAPSGETPSDDHGCSQISPQIGITNTPVIDRLRGPHGTIYFVAMTKDSSGKYHQRLHALDLTTGAEQFGGPAEITASYPGSGDNSQNGQVIFDPAKYAERVGLLAYGGKIYLAFTSHCDSRPYTGWLMAYDALTLAQTSVLNVTPNGNEGAIWMAGAGWPPIRKAISTSSMGTGRSIPRSTPRASPQMATTETRS